jgi:lipoprotein-anchoring transpeptidase ErfK/SrfK
MASQYIPPSQALKQAKEALQRGDKHAARTWAQIAAALAPDMEDLWLILAAVAKPRASIAYLNRALEINPYSQRARAGLEWAFRQRANQQTEAGMWNSQPPSVPTDLTPNPNTISQKADLDLYVPTKVVAKRRPSILVPVLIVVVCLAAALAVWPGVSSAASAAIRNTASTQDGSLLSWLPAGRVKPTVTPTPTAIVTETATPSPTSTPPVTASPTPFQPATATATFTATPLPTNTPQPTNTQEFIPTQPPANGGKLIVVSISQQHLYAYQGSTLVYSFVASTGSGNSTSTGTFSILDKIPRALGADWNFWMPDWMGIYYVGDLENGIHSLPVLPNGQRLWGDSIGTPVTYGCVVLGEEDALELYNWAEIGTTVQINR